MYSRFRCWPPKHRLATVSGYVDLAEQIAAGIVAAHAVFVRIAPTDRAPDIAGGVGAHAVGDAGLGHFGKDLAVGYFAAFDIHVEDANVRRIVRTVGEAGVDDVELLLVRREGNAVRFDEVVDDDFDIAGFRIDPIDIVLVLFGRGFDAFVIAADAVDRIGEPDRAVGSDGCVVRRVQPLAVVLVGDDGDRAVKLGAGHAPAAVFASDQPAFAIDRVAVGIHRRLPEYAHMAVVLAVAHDAVVGNVAEQHVAAGREIDRAFRPAKAGGDTFDSHRAGEGRETGRSERNLGLFERLQVGIRIAAPG